MAKYTSQSYRDHLKLKKGAGAQASARTDRLYEAAQARKPNYDAAKRRPEVGISIQVGLQNEDAPQDAP